MSSNTTTIGGKTYAFLECVMRFERGDDEGAAWHIDGTCKRVGLRDPDTAARTAIFIQELRSPELATELGRAPEYDFGDARVLVDTDREEWLETDLGLTCPKCLRHCNDVRLLTAPGVNPFTGEPFTPETLAGGADALGFLTSSSLGGPQLKGLT